MTYDADVCRAIRLIQDDIKGIIRRIERIEKRPDMLFKEQWMDTHDTALALNISERHLRTLRQSGILPFSRIHKKIFFNVADIKNMLEQNTVRRALKPKS